MSKVDISRYVTTSLVYSDRLKVARWIVTALFVSRKKTSVMGQDQNDLIESGLIGPGEVSLLGCAALAHKSIAITEKTG